MNKRNLTRALILSACIIFSLAVVFTAWSANVVNTGRLHSQQKVEIHVSTGSTEISGADVDSVQVTIERGGDQKWRNEHVRIDRNRNPVLVDIDDLPQFAQVRILVPEAAGIAVSMGAGELKIRGVHGDQLALLRAGEMTIDVGEPKDYRAARAFVLSGEVQAPAFDTTTGGLWRMRTWKGPGHRVLDAQVTTGHLVLQ